MPVSHACHAVSVLHAFRPAAEEEVAEDVELAVEKGKATREYVHWGCADVSWYPRLCITACDVHVVRDIYNICSLMWHPIDAPHAACVTLAVFNMHHRLNRTYLT